MTTKMGTRGLALALLVATITTSPASALEEPSLPIVASASMGRYAWVWLDLVFPAGLPAGDALSISFEGTGPDANAMGLGWWDYTGGEPSGAFLSTSWGSSTDFYLRGPEPVGVVIDTREHRENGRFFASAGMRFLESPTEDVVVGQVVGFALEAISAQSTLTVRAHPDVEISSIRIGDRGFMFRDQGFDSALAVHAPRSSALVDGTATVTATGRLFGWFGAGTPAAVLRYAAPSGTRYGGEVMYGSEAGTHTFSVVGAAGAIANRGAWAWGLDIDPDVVPG
jgi:hypothetical protein